ncbi:Programmed cell death protein 6 [Sphaceloma murrayae]|uniref:Programmed cell death protein 6 n=1 Tax=Sphaceloma murrayae TaxID=2082308 RepID=A0A2K1QRZ1_9PEZI|nr:Programmed cell death protein 6 [Sphaceloma murrayae]
MSSASPSTNATSSVPTPTAPLFTPVAASAQDGPTSSPAGSSSPTSSNALARFEYESGRTRDCTKVLMVEWEEDATTRQIRGEWTVTWEGKQTVLPASGRGQGGDDGEVAEGGINRLYFLLPEGERVPGIVWLTLTPSNTTSDDNAAAKKITWKANPLPAIFPPELGASAREAGKKGVLHTIWAKRRLQVLAREIDEEGKANAEGIALEMALQERDWIETHFGVSTRPPSTQQEGHRPSLAGLGEASLRSPTSPRSPGGSRLMDKLRGLKLKTGDVKNHQQPNDDGHLDDTLNPLSPEQSDVAVSSFSSFAQIKGMPDPSTLAAKPPQVPAQGKRFAPQRPPEEIIKQQQAIGPGSLNALASGQAPFTSRGQPSRDDDREDDLFALPISPRSPDMGKSPFTFAASDTMRYTPGEKA